VRLPGESSGAELEITEAERLGLQIYRMTGLDMLAFEELTDWLESHRSPMFTNTRCSLLMNMKGK
jgi:hypothetical protein